MCKFKKVSLRYSKLYAKNIVFVLTFDEFYLFKYLHEIKSIQKIVE